MCTLPNMQFSELKKPTQHVSKRKKPNIALKKQVLYVSSYIPLIKEGSEQKTNHFLLENIAYISIVRLLNETTMKGDKKKTNQSAPKPSSFLLLSGREFRGLTINVNRLSHQHKWRAKQIDQTQKSHTYKFQKTCCSSNQNKQLGNTIQKARVLTTQIDNWSIVSPSVLVNQGSEVKNFKKRLGFCCAGRTACFLCLALFFHRR